MKALVALGDAMNGIFIGGDDSSINGYGATLLETVESSLYTSMSAAALAICACFFLISIIQLATERELTMEYFIKYFSKLIISGGAIMYCKELTDGLYGIGTGLGDLVASSFTPGDGDLSSLTDRSTIATNLCKQMSENNLASAISVFLKAFPIMLVLILAGIVLYVISYIVGYTRILELAVRAGFMPLALACLSDDGWRGAGGRYIRKFLAICAQVAVLIMISKVTTVIMADAFTLGGGGESAADDIFSMFKAPLVCIGAGFAAVSLMFKSLSIINDVFGA